MAVPARIFERENPMEERLARLEATTEHIQSDVSDLKGKLQRLETRMDAGFERLDKKVDALEKKMEAKVDSVKDALTALEGRMRDSFEALRVGRAMDKVWALLAIAGLLGVMARGFKWI